MSRHLFHPAHLWDLFVASDPDLGRLRMGLRSVVAAALALVLLTLLARWLGEPSTVPMIGSMVAMMGSQLATDPEPRAQRLTTLLMVLPATASVVLGTLASHVPLLGAAAFAVTIFLATYVRRFGPRWASLGMIGFFAFFFALFFHAELTQVPALVGALVFAVGIAYTVRFGLVRDRPDRDPQRVLHSFRRTVSIVLWELAALPRQPRLNDALMRRLRLEADRLNDAALMVEQSLAGRGQGGFRQRVFDLELATHRLLGAVYQVVDSGALPLEARREIREALAAARAAVRDRDPEARGKVREHLDHVWASLPSASNSERGHADARRLCISLTDLVEAAVHFPDEVPPLPSEATTSPSANGPPPATPLEGTRLHPATRQAIQATVASVLAMGAGYAVSPERWYWAVISAFVIFTQASTLGDTVLRAWHRVLGTLLGVIAGLLLARLVIGHRTVELASIFACVFFGFYLMRLSYAWMIFWFTTMLAVLYSLLGRLSAELLYLRLEETVIGAGIGVAIALLLFPQRMTAYLRSAEARVLSAVCAHLEAAVVRRSKEADPAHLLDSTRALDTSLRDLRTAASPLTGRLVRFAPGIARMVHSVSVLVFSARHLVPGRGFLDGREELRELIREAGIRLAHNARTLARSLERGEAPEIVPASTLIEKARRSLVGEETVRRGPASPAVMLHWLERVDDALNLLAATASPSSLHALSPQR